MAGNEPDLDHMHAVALDLARAAGKYALERFDGENGARAKGSGADVVTEVDHAAEARIIARLTEEFPDHAVLGEETGAHGSTDAVVRWLVDPLDGTNNYVLGLPLFGVCLTACLGTEPVVAVMYDSVRQVATSARRGGGAFRDGRALRLPGAQPLARTTVSWSQGYGVGPADPFRIGAMAALEGSVKRVLRTWSPSIDWGLLAAGSTGAIVLYRNEVWDMVGGLLIATEAGGVVYRQQDRDCVIAGQHDTVAGVSALLDLPLPE